MVEQLAGAVARSLVTVVGPQCAGTIGLLAYWVRTHCDRQPVDWLVIHADRDDPATFWRSVLAALDLTGVTLPDIEPPVPGERLPAAFIIRLAARLGEHSRPVVLVVDDAEHLTRRETVESLDLLVRNVDRLRLVLCARADVPPSLDLFGPPLTAP